MKKRNYLRALLGITLAGTLIFSCTSEDINSMQEHPKIMNLLTSNEQTVNFKIGYDVPEG